MITWLRAGAYAVVALLFSYPLASLTAMVAAAMGAFFGRAAAKKIGGGPVRSWVIVTCAAMGIWAIRLVIAKTLALGAPILGLSAEMHLRLLEAFVWGEATLLGACALGVVVERHPVATIVEVLVAGWSVAQLLAAHRFGAIHRPFELADPILAQGGDPTKAILAMGLAGAFLIASLLSRERKLFRRVLQLAAVLALLSLVVFMRRIPSPESAQNALGLRGESKNEKDGKHRNGTGQKPKNELDFKDDYPRDRSRAPVAVVLFHDDYSPPSGVYYFRQDALSTFNGRKLVHASLRGVDNDVSMDFTGIDTQNGKVGPRDKATEARFRQTLESTVALLADHPKPFGLETPIRIAQSINPDPSRFRRVYTVTSASLTSDAVALLGRQAGSPSWSKAVWDHYTQFPNDARYGNLATTIIQKLPEQLRADAAARAWAVTAWLGKQGTYSLRSRHAGAEDPTADFLFGDKTGYCVHFAHAVTYLLRALKLPARVATGYATPESARQGGSSLLLSDQDAHAWAEVYLDGVGWVMADVTPEKVLDPPPDPPDPELQRLLGELARGQKPIPTDEDMLLPSLIARLRVWLMRIGISLLWSLALGIAFLYLMKIWRRLSPRWASALAWPRVGYRATLDALADFGIYRQTGETREAFSARLQAIAPTLSDLTQIHLKSAFGKRQSRSLVDPQVRKILTEKLASELKTSPIARTRRVIGAIIPWTWLKVR